MNQPLLSILIPTTYDRALFLDKLNYQINSQIGPSSKFDLLASREYLELSVTTYNDVEVIVYFDKKQHSIGSKRNELLDRSNGKYIAFIDDDDRISDDYFNLLIPGLEKGVDCCSLKGIITEDGQNPLLFEHSIKYNEYKTNPEGIPVRYERYPNHLNAIRSDIARQFKFPEKNHGEDTDWATQIFKSGLLKTEYYIDEVLYYYDYRSKK